MEYRLNVAGFLSLAALGKQGANYGLLDVILALEWVQHNIANFGGDPGRVTVWGQSSGGSLVFALLASPLLGRQCLPRHHQGLQELQGV